MSKNYHEVRDPVHGFIVFDDHEKSLIDSPPVQRLRDIHQLALEYMVYPGATHKRFEHSLGVLHLAGQIFDSLFTEGKLMCNVRDRISSEIAQDKLAYWRRVVRIAGLLHDIGHMPFSHTGEKLLPEGTTHEDITEAFIKSDEIKELLMAGKPPIQPDDIFKCAVDYKKRPDLMLSPWETLLNDIITSDVFGADRMDYLLRDSMYTGVAYGRFDVDRLIGCMCILIDNREKVGTDEIALGVDIGGLHSAEGLLLSRYFMYEQVYYHKIRKIYDLHLTDFLIECLNGETYPTDPYKVINLTDNHFLAEMHRHSLDKSSKLFPAATRIKHRKHFRCRFSLTKTLCEQTSPDIFEEIIKELGKQVDKEGFRYFPSKPLSSNKSEFLVLDDRQGRILSASEESGIVRDLPNFNIGYIYCSDLTSKQVLSIIDDVVHMVQSKVSVDIEGEGNELSEPKDLA